MSKDLRINLLKLFDSIASFEPMIEKILAEKKAFQPSQADIKKLSDPKESRFLETHNNFISLLQLIQMTQPVAIREQMVDHFLKNIYLIDPCWGQTLRRAANLVQFGIKCSSGNQSRPQVSEQDHKTQDPERRLIKIIHLYTWSLDPLLLRFRDFDGVLLSGVQLSETEFAFANIMYGLVNGLNMGPITALDELTSLTKPSHIFQRAQIGIEKSLQRITEIVTPAAEETDLESSASERQLMPMTASSSDDDFSNSLITIPPQESPKSLTVLEQKQELAYSQSEQSDGETIYYDIREIKECEESIRKVVCDSDEESEYEDLVFYDAKEDRTPLPIESTKSDPTQNPEKKQEEKSFNDHSRLQYFASKSGTIDLREQLLKLQVKLLANNFARLNILYKRHQRRQQLIIMRTNGKDSQSEIIRLRFTHVKLVELIQKTDKAFIAVTKQLQAVKQERQDNLIAAQSLLSMMSND